MRQRLAVQVRTKTAGKVPTWKEDRLLAAVCGTRLVQVGIKMREKFPTWMCEP